MLTLHQSASSVLTLAAPSAQLLPRHAVLSDATRMFSSKDDVIVRFLMLSMYCTYFPRHHSENACLNKTVRIIVSACMSKEYTFFFSQFNQYRIFLLFFNAVNASTELLQNYCPFHVCIALITLATKANDVRRIEEIAIDV